jgi:hypothetical protein
MKYIFVGRPLQSPNYKYDKKYLPGERVTLSDIRNAQVSNKPITFSHGPNKDEPAIGIGEFMMDWEGRDNSKYSLGYIECDSMPGQVASAMIDYGKAKFFSPVYELITSVKEDPKTGEQYLDYQKKYHNFALTDTPDFTEAGGPEIIFGAYENDLNINFDRLKNTPMEIYKALKAKAVENAMASQATPSTPVPTPQVAPVPTTEAKAPEQKTDENSEGNIEKVIEILHRNPGAADTLTPEQTKYALLNLAKKITDPQQQVPTKTGQPASANPGQGQAPFTQVAPPPEDWRQSLADMFNGKMDALASSMQTFSDGMHQKTGQKMDLTHQKNAIENFKKNVSADPSAKSAVAGLGLADSLHTVFVHANALNFSAQNDESRQKINNMQHTVDAANLQKYLGPIRTQSTPSQPSTPYDRTNEKKADASNGDFEMSIAKNLIKKYASGMQTPNIPGATLSPSVPVNFRAAYYEQNPQYNH